MQNKISKRHIANQSCVTAESGVALIAVLWTTVLLSMLATALITMSRSDAHLLVAERVRLQTREIAQAGINLAILGLSDPKGGCRVDGTTQSFRFDDTMVDVAVFAESGKIDLNTGDIDLIRSLLSVSGANPATADRIAGAILERRSAASLSDNSLQTDFSSGRGGLFQNFGELLQMPGMTHEIYDRLVPNLTFYSGSASVDKVLASSAVLLAIANNIPADAQVVSVARSPSDSRPAVELSEIIGQAFSVVATAKAQDGSIVRKTEVVRLTGNFAQPLWVLAID